MMNGSMIRDRYDVVIAGARIAGASTAMLLARGGLRVLVVDPQPGERDTLSTHALMRGGVLQLHRWGLLDEVRASGAPAVHTTTFHYPDETIEIPIKPADGVDALYAPRRIVIDPILAAAAQRAGAHVIHGAAVSELMRDQDGRVRAVLISGPDQAPVTVHTDLVIGADGIHSKTARLAGAPVLRAMPHAAAVIYGHWPGLGIDGYHWRFGPGLGSGTIPTNDGVTCIFASLPADRFRAAPAGSIRDLYRGAIRALDPETDGAIAHMEAEVRLRAFAGVPGFIRRSAGPGWALVGDASYFRDPLTAHGMTDALRDAEYLARAILSADPDTLLHWQTERDEQVSPFMEITDRICSFEWSTTEVKELHVALARAMNTPVNAIRKLDAAGAEIRLSLERAVV
jgi:flavin-dependent dehydrogenase